MGEHVLQQKWLIVLDLNGTLVETSYRRVPSQYYQSRARHKFVYHRPFLQHFLDFLFHHPRVGAVAVWTSCVRENAEAIVENLFSGRPSLLFVWNREECEKIPQSENYGTIKNLERVWRRCPDGEYGAHNTLLVDDSEEKAQRQLENHVWVPEFHVENRLHDSGLLIAIRTIRRRFGEEVADDDGGDAHDNDNDDDDDDWTTVGAHRHHQRGAVGQ